MSTDRQSLLDFYERHKYRRDFDREAEPYREVLRLTTFLDDVYHSVPFAQRIWHLKNDNLNVQLCPVCSTPIEWDGRHRQYARFCSLRCWSVQVKTEDEQQKRKQKTLERFGVEEYGLSEEYRTKMEASVSERRKKQNERLRHSFLDARVRYEDTSTDAQQQLVDFVRSVYDGRIEENTKDVIPPQELDVYLPDLNLALEYNGLWFHSSLFLPDNYHKDKTDRCQDKEVRLIHVFEDDWTHRRAIMEDILRTAICPRHRQSVYARRCSIEPLDMKTTNDFLEENHLQGGVLTQTVAYGLVFDGSLVALVSFVRYRDGYVLQRYAVRLGFTVLGAFSRLLCHFVKQHPPRKVVTYSDRSIFTGDIYRRCGFRPVCVSRPQFTFLDAEQHRRLPKQVLRRLGNGYRRQDDPFPRVYNCGLVTWELNL
jgi:endogenous inhibitor of DNA gyrase (YacG/DUF329 family)